MIRKKPTTINIMFHKGLIITVAAFIAASPAAYAKPTTPNVGGGAGNHSHRYRQD